MAPRQQDEYVYTVTRTFIEEAKKDGGGDVNDDEINEIAGYFGEMINTPGGQKLLNKAKVVARRTHGGFFEKINAAAKILFDGCKQFLKTMAQAAVAIVQGIFYIFCFVVAIVAALLIGIIALVANIIYTIVRGAWAIIKSVTGFVWSMLKAAAKSPATWACIMGLGAGLVFTNPVVGGIVATVGVIGVICTV